MGTSGWNMGTVKMAIGDELVLANDPEEEPEEEAEEEEEEEEEELVDPQDTLKESCAARPDCQKYKVTLDACNERVGGADTEETCEEELVDFLHCVDNCMHKSLFSKLK